MIDQARQYLSNHGSPAVLALALVLSTASQLRFLGKVGIGEVLLLGWLAVEIPRAARLVSWRQDHLFRYTVLLLAVFWLGLCLGWLWSLVQGTTAPDAVYTGAAVLYATFAALLVSSKLGRQYFAFELAHWIILIGVVPLFLLALVSLFRADFLSLQLMYGGVRFQGWARNPNQIAFLFASLPFLASYMATQSSSPWGKLGYAVAAAAAFYVGLRTASDAVTLSWMIAIFVAALLVLGRTLRDRVGRSSYLGLLSVRTMIGAALVLAFAMAFLVYLNIGLLPSGSADQVSVRLALWKNGLYAFTHSPFVGHGPGAHSGLDGPFKGSETHNTLLDAATQAGLLGVGAVGFAFGYAVWKAMVPLKATLLAATIALLGVASFHYVLRHPAYWILIFLVWALAAQPVRKLAASVESFGEPTIKKEVAVGEAT